jgi:23S rRNA (uracil1939-C5)-methyltransferase
VRATVGITGIAAGGAGVGRLPDGVAVFVHRTAPGDEAEIRIVERKRRWARGELLRLRTAGPDRREPPCPHYARCGGCTLEHLRYEAQLRWKGTLVREALRRIGGIAAEPPEVVPSPNEFRYRNRVSFTLLRTGAGRVIAGFHEIQRPDRVLDIDERCLLPESALADVWRDVRRAWGENAGRLPSGDELRLTLRAAADGSASLFVDGGYHPGRPDELLARVPRLTAIWHRARGAGEGELLAGSPALDEAWGEENVALSGAVFLQVNRDAAALLEQHVEERAGDVAGLRVVDAYCGVGLHARRLARRGARVVGIELDPIAIREAVRTAPAGARFIAGAVEDHLGGELPADLVIVNPPRAGLDARVTSLLAATPPKRLLYVSCDPATLARDLARLQPSLTLSSIRCFDLFPQTAHVETVVELTCATS